MKSFAIQQMKSFQDIIFDLQRFWADFGCVVMQPYDTEVGAGTSHYATTLKALGNDYWNVAFVQPCRRPKDGRYAENPNRTQYYYQFQVILKPAPFDPQSLYLNSLKYAGFDLDVHELRFVEDDWENPSLGAAGIGWEIWCDGMEITQFTYFQQVGGLACHPVTAEITYGLERLASYIQEVESVYDLEWTKGVKYGEIFRHPEYEHSKYAFEESNQEMLFKAFDVYETEAKKQIANGLVHPAYDYILKCSHTFNLLDARGAVSVTERAGYLARIRNMAKAVAKVFVAERKKLGYPLIKDEKLRQELLKEDK